MTAEARGVPPSIDGYTYVRWLGGGGFADVFLYDQHMPERQVAVKVLRATVDDDDARRLFAAEANLMARVSTHPNIVTIHSASVSADRRPYLVMQYYPLEHFGERIRAGGMPFQSVLQVGVKLACAIETAHQARIVHRDIKPANVLVSDFGEPGLADFGISAAQTDLSTDDSVGFSPAYAPPEILADVHPGDARSDIYSLAATLWALLAGHAPFERPGVQTTRGEMIARGLNDVVPPLPRADVPASLELLLRQALDKDATRRPSSAKSFAMSLRAVEGEAGFRETELVLLHDRGAIASAVAAVEVAAEMTKRGTGIVVNLDPGVTNRRGAPTSHPTGPPGLEPLGGGAALIGAVPTGGQPVPLPRSVPALAPTGPPVPLPAPARAPVADTMMAARTATPVSEPPHQDLVAGRRTPRWAWAIAGAVAAAIGAGVAISAAGSTEATPASTSAVLYEDVVNPGAEAEGTLSPITDLRGGRDGTTVVFTWTHEPREGLRYLVERVDAGVVDPPSMVEEATYVLEDVPAGESPCIAVTAVIEGQVASEQSEPRCVA